MGLDYINENCNICGKDFSSIDEVYVDVDTDNYVCLECVQKYGIQANEAMRLLSYEEGEWYAL